MNRIGPRLKQLRDEQGMTQEEFTARCNVNGWDISRGTLAKIESQIRRVTDEEVAKLADALNVEIGVLYEG